MAFALVGIWHTTLGLFPRHTSSYASIGDSLAQHEKPRFRKIKCFEFHHTPFGLCTIKVLHMFVTHLFSITMRFCFTYMYICIMTCQNSLTMSDFSSTTIPGESHISVPDAIRKLRCELWVFIFVLCGIRSQGIYFLISCIFVISQRWLSSNTTAGAIFMLRSKCITESA